VFDEVYILFHFNIIPEDDKELRPKHVGAIINKQKTFSNKFVLNIMFFFSSPPTCGAAARRGP
jgi:hypothetical protein